MGKTRSKKTGYHSTSSSRKYVGMLNTLLGLANPDSSFKDLDDMMSSPKAERKLPFWVKEVDEPTVEIDWERLKPFPSVFGTLFNPEVYGEKEYFEMVEAQKQRNIECMKNNVPGYKVQDNAMANAVTWLWKGFDIPWTGPKWEPDPLHQVFYTPEEYGVPRYEGTPQESSRLIQTAARVFGASEVGFVKLNDRTKKLLFGNIRFENVEEGYDPGDGTLVLPDKDLWVICAVIPQSLVLGKASKDSNWAGTNALAYSLMNVYSGRMQSFIRSLGYQAYGGNGMIGANIGFGVMAGLGEYSRSTQLVSPYFGNMIRTILPTVTDLPVAETKPIDAGILQFCKTCKKCGSTCPSGAISMKDEPFWGGGDKPYQNEGLKGYYYNGKLCFNHVFSQPTNCGICQTVCPYNKMDKAFIHKVIKASISKMGSVPGVNKFIADMDDVFGYGLEDTEKTSVWDRDPKEIPLFGLDESRS